MRIGAREIAYWRSRALCIPDPLIRQDALSALDNKRTHAHGAGLFCILPRHRSRNLLRLLVSYELIWDFLDNLSERAAATGFTDGRALHSAIAEAIDPDGPISDYYGCLPWDDDGYLRSLVLACRSYCDALPSYASVRDLALSDARMAQVLAINHNPNPALRDAALQAWAAEHRHEFAGMPVPWWELCGAASAPMAIHLLLALAAEPNCRPAEVRAAHAVYFPWLAAATTMLDSFVDRAEDESSGAHSYVAHYPDVGQVATRVQHLVRQSLAGVQSLERGAKHAIIAASMVAMYLSKVDATPASRQLIRAGGPLTRALLPVLRLWRYAFGQVGV